MVMDIVIAGVVILGIIIIWRGIKLIQFHASEEPPRGRRVYKAYCSHCGIWYNGHPIHCNKCGKMLDHHESFDYD
jgi:hypothetical protein